MLDLLVTSSVELSILSPDMTDVVSGKRDNWHSIDRMLHSLHASAGALKSANVSVT